MDILFDYLEKKYKILNLKFYKKDNELVIANHYYYFKIKKIQEKYILSRFWKRFFFRFLFKKQLINMTNIYNDIYKFSQKNNLIIEELSIAS